VSALPFFQIVLLFAGLLPLLRIDFLGVFLPAGGGRLADGVFRQLESPLQVGLSAMSWAARAFTFLRRAGPSS
jgi:hypothetical protein